MPDVAPHCTLQSFHVPPNPNMTFIARTPVPAGTTQMWYQVRDFIGSGTAGIDGQQNSNGLPSGDFNDGYWGERWLRAGAWHGPIAWDSASSPYSTIYSWPDGNDFWIDVQWCGPTPGTYCEYGTELQQPGKLLQVLTPALLDTALARRGAPWLGAFLSSYLYTMIDAGSLCGNGPPAMPTFDVGDLVNITIGRQTESQTKLGDALLSLL